MSLTNPNTPVSQQDLQDFYHKLLPYMGGSFGLVATGIDSANLYSTTERVIGQWIDGKPLYQKTFTGTSGGNGADATFGSISNAETIVSLRGIVRNSNNMMHGAPNPGIYLKYYNGNIQTYTSDAQFGNQPCSITVQYTKTTDSAVESYGTDTTYSTDEHVVGSWIDGRPVYQRTITGVNTPSSKNSDATIYTFDSTVDIITDIRGYLLDQSIASKKGSIPINVYYANDAYITVFTGDANGDSTKRVLRCRVSGWINSPLYVTVQYVKKVSS